MYYIVYAVELFLVGDGIFHDRVRGKTKYAVMAGVYLAVIVPAVLCFDHPAFIILALNLSLYMVLFQGNKMSRFIHFVGVYLLTNMAESVVFGIGVILSGRSFGQSEIGAARPGELSLFFAVAVTALLLYIIHRKRTQNFILYFRALDWFQYVVIILIVWSGILLLGILTAMPEYAGDKKVILIFMATALTGVILLVFSAYRKDYYRKQSEIKEEIIHVQQMYFQKIYDNDREIRKFRHDINAQLQCLGLLLADGKTEAALEHLQRIGDHFEELAVPTYHTGNEILDVIINQKIQEAKKKHIRIKVEGKMDKPDFMDTYDLCTLFSNMLDNSIAAYETIQDTEAVITVSILTHRNTVLFQFTNPATAEMYETIRHGGTTKGDRKNHGFGLENIRRVVDQNGGEIGYLFKDGTLTTELYFEI